ncbi:MAG: MMPL family transporter [Betaproteobacteria bacterium]|nr:MMPL family transporter [Betaproteobacteria bacterium]
MKRRALLAIGIWIAGLIGCGIIVGRTHFTADLSAFLPRAPTAEQRILVDQLKDGAVSRLVLLGIEGADAPARAALSRSLGDKLRASGALTAVHNGDATESERDRQFLLENRYLLSAAVAPARFTEHGLRTAIGESIALLASPAGMMLKNMLPRDPTGELVRMLGQFDGESGPPRVDGVWASRDGARALLLAQTRAAGSDIDGQQQAQAAIHAAFEDARRELGATAATATLLATGPGVFAVAARATIQREVLRLSLLGTALIASLLLLAYRSFTALGLGLLPVASGALAAVAAVSLGFGEVHGLTLGFGTTLIGEAVDYSIYLFIQSRRDGAGASDGDGGARDSDWLARFWPTIRLGVLTSVFGFASLLFSGFPGLAQLGLYSITGLIVAATVTRFVLPNLLPADFRIRDITRLGAALAKVARRAGAWRAAVAVLALVAGAVLIAQRATLWNAELAALSPISAADQARDQALRSDLGAPDVRYLVIASGADMEAALQAAEQAAAALQPLVDAGTLGGFESPTRYLPSAAAQAARQAALPPREELLTRLRTATQELPIRPERLTPFVDDVEAARARKPLLRADLDGTAAAQAVDALLLQQGGRWNAVLSLRAPQKDGATLALDPAGVRAALAATTLSGALFVDVKGETDQLYAGYLREAIWLSLGGLAAIVALLLAALRSPVRVLRVLAPLAAAVLVVIAGLALAGMQLTILHLVGMLLIVAVGSNYALFFDQRAVAVGREDDERMLASLLCANVTTVAGFGMLAFSSVPVLQAIGITVGPGAILALVFSAILAGRADAPATR